MKKIGVMALSAILAVSIPFSSLASLATPSNMFQDPNYPEHPASLVTPEEWEMLIESGDVSEPAIAPYSSIRSITNTVNRSAVYFRVEYYDMNNVIHVSDVYLNSDGYFHVKRPGNLARIYRLSFVLGKAALPPSGKYAFQVDFSSDFGGMEYRNFVLAAVKLTQNADAQGASKFYGTFQQASGDFFFETNLDLGNVHWVQLLWQVNDNWLFSEYGGYASFSFRKLANNADTDFNTPGTSDADKAADTANNTAQIADNTAQMNDTLKEIVQQISNQLAALWDQMYNYMHLEQMRNDDKNTGLIIDRLDEGFDVYVDTDDRNTDRIIENDNKNTDTIINGFDNSGMNEGNSKLDGALNEYDTAEDNIVSSVSGYLNDFQMPDYSSAPPGVLTACIYFGNWLQRLFEAIGAFNFPITLSLTLIFVLMLIGYHRFRSG